MPYDNIICVYDRYYFQAAGSNVVAGAVLVTGDNEKGAFLLGSGLNYLARDMEVLRSSNESF